jgi:hypothetical protein
MQVKLGSFLFTTHIPVAHKFNDYRLQVAVKERVSIPGNHKNGSAASLSLS